MRLEGKIVLVTGGASGIGRATCEVLASAGAHVYVADIDADKGAETVQAVLRDGGTAEFIEADVTNRTALENAAASLMADKGRLDVLVNAAGWDIIQPFAENTFEYIDKIVALNFLGPVNVTKIFLPLLQAADAATIVNVASDAGRVGSSGETVYAGAKGGVIAFTKSLAREVARYSIRVNCVCPGPTDTPLFHSQPEKMREALVRAIPMRRLCKPEEVANTILFLASDSSDFITGQLISVSGGLTMAG